MNGMAMRTAPRVTQDQDLRYYTAHTVVHREILPALRASKNGQANA